jgi:hypothetical protein
MARQLPLSVVLKAMRERSHGRPECPACGCPSFVRSSLPVPFLARLWRMGRFNCLDCGRLLLLSENALARSSRRRTPGS